MIVTRRQEESCRNVEIKKNLFSQVKECGWDSDSDNELDLICVSDLCPLDQITLHEYSECTQRILFLGIMLVYYFGWSEIGRPTAGRSTDRFRAFACYVE
ncbi:hypothetical protein B9Z55_020088 [Caenorhabditis nigoni]|uniref:Uncharacterized protein n=1 Tax=Caenorhabditis nigoni TaxID=1611254 RepID=A0A2G5TL77_9PELO|nr:hypothetical protein B9Z55_020088 [Caenorhabditis nigoni]